MKKVRVIKEMPFAKVGTVIELDEVRSNSIVINTIDGLYYRFVKDELTYLIEDKWLEWVKEEKSLEEKFKIMLFSVARRESELSELDYLHLSSIATTHFLEAFDNITVLWDGEPLKKAIRQALQKAGGQNEL